MTTTESITLTNAIAFYLEHVATERLKPSTLYSNRVTLRKWANALGDKPIDNISTSDLLQVRDNLATPATKNRYISVLSSVFKTAIERNWVTDNPCTKIQRVRNRNKFAGKLITRDTEDKLMAFASRPGIPNEFFTLLLILFSTGCRLGEALALTHDDIVPGSKATLAFLNTKNGKDRVIPISDSLADRLGYSDLPKAEYRSLWRKACEHIGEHYRYHDIRHTVITRMLQAGISPMDVGEYVGHSSIAMTAHYRQDDTENLRRKMIW